jgi:hypothetical protein
MLVATASGFGERTPEIVPTGAHRLQCYVANPLPIVKVESLITGLIMQVYILTPKQGASRPIS